MGKIDPKLLNSRFIKKLNVKFSNKLSLYKNSMYKGQQFKIKIVCKTCNNTENNYPKAILSRICKNGCLFCSKKKKLESDTYIMSLIRYFYKRKLNKVQISRLLNQNNPNILKSIKIDIKNRKSDYIRVVAFDPGTKSFAISVVDLYGSKNLIKFKIIHSGMIDNPIAVLDEFYISRCIKFEREIFQLYKKYKPNIIVSERFQTRGYKGSGNINELCNMMIGKLSMVSMMDRNKIPLISLIMPVRWKSHIKRVIDLDKLYIKYKRIGPHRLDSLLMALYHYPNLDNNIFSFLKNDKKVNRLKTILKKNKGKLYV